MSGSIPSSISLPRFRSIIYHLPVYPLFSQSYYARQNEFHRNAYPFFRPMFRRIVYRHSSTKAAFNFLYHSPFTNHPTDCKNVLKSLLFNLFTKAQALSVWRLIHFQRLSQHIESLFLITLRERRNVNRDTLKPLRMESQYRKELHFLLNSYQFVLRLDGYCLEWKR